MRRKAENNINYQTRALQFNVGDTVVPYGLLDSQSGRVTAVYPAIGMIDVEFATGNKRVPAEQLIKKRPDGDAIPPLTVSTPAKTASAKKVALYWAEKDRKYRATKSECGQQIVFCPKCDGVALRKTTYSRSNGSNEHLLGCPSCLFLIRFEDIPNHWVWGE